MKRALVTGATKGIGLGIAKLLLMEGYFVTITYGRNEEVAKECRKVLSEISDNFEVIRASQSSEREISELVKYLREKDTIDCIVCNAGISVRGHITEVTNELWHEVFQTNLTSHFYIIRDLFDIIPSNSRIIFIGSQMGIHPHAMSLPYGVSKAAIHALALNLVKFFEYTGTTVNVIAPGFIETEWHKNKPAFIRNNIEKKVALHRFGTIEEIESVVKVIIHNGAINGAVINIDGGYCYDDNDRINV